MSFNSALKRSKEQVIGHGLTGGAAEGPGGPSGAGKTSVPAVDSSDGGELSLGDVGDGFKERGRKQATPPAARLDPFRGDLGKRLAVMSMSVMIALRIMGSIGHFLAGHNRLANFPSDRKHPDEGHPPRAHRRKGEMAGKRRGARPPRCCSGQRGRGELGSYSALVHELADGRGFYYFDGIPDVEAAGSRSSLTEGASQPTRVEVTPGTLNLFRIDTAFKGVPPDGAVPSLPEILGMGTLIERRDGDGIGTRNMSSMGPTWCGDLSQSTRWCGKRWTATGSPKHREQQGTAIY